MVDSTIESLEPVTRGCLNIFIYLLGSVVNSTSEIEVEFTLICEMMSMFRAESAGESIGHHQRLIIATADAEFHI